MPMVFQALLVERCTKNLGINHCEGVRHAIVLDSYMRLDLENMYRLGVKL